MGLTFTRKNRRINPRRLLRTSVVSEIPLTKGMTAYVSPEDYDMISKLSWSSDCKGTKTIKWYAVTRIVENGRSRKISMHRFLMEPLEPGLEVDHIDHDGLNNRRENLRIVTHRDNLINRLHPHGQR